MFVTPGARDGVSPVDPPPDVIGALFPDVVVVPVVGPVPTVALPVVPNEPATDEVPPGMLSPLPDEADGAVEPGTASESLVVPATVPVVSTVEPQAVTKACAVAAMTGAFHRLGVTRTLLVGPVRLPEEVKAAARLVVDLGAHHVATVPSPGKELAAVDERASERSA